MKTKSITEGWTGLTDLNADESLQWVDGSPTDFFYWAPNGDFKYFLMIFTNNFIASWVHT